MTIALICMVLFDMLVTKNTGDHNLTQVNFEIERTKERKEIELL